MSATTLLSPAAGWFLLVLFHSAALGQTVTLDPLVVSATRAATPRSRLPFTITTLDEDTLRSSPELTLDSALRSIPSFSLFRRSDSLVAHPTTQGVSLRGLGPSGASRSLVLLDGAPLNDPFGGWINWNKVPRESLVGAEIVRSGGATAWGNAALAGIIQLTTSDSHDRREQVAALAGSFDTYRIECVFAEPLGPDTLQIETRDFATDGFPTLARENRGSVDNPASSRHRWLNASWRHPFGADNQLTLTARTFSESRNNGTPGQNNAAHERFLSASLPVHLTPVLDLTTTAYVQSQRFSSTFTSVNPDRSAETPASDQFAVPTTATGAAATFAWTEVDAARTTGGFDFRTTNGETREDFSFANDGFTRRRFAGGAQSTFGLYAQREQPFGREWQALFGARLDRWTERNGHRREVTLADGTILRDDVFRNRSGWELSPSAGLVWRPGAAWRFHGSLQRAFRRPTLNELYRPFRQGNDITDANPALSTEHAWSEEIGATWTGTAFTASIAVFHSELRDAVSNVTVATGPGRYDDFGFIPAGGTGRRRLNLDQIRVQGLEASATWSATPELKVDVAYQFNDGEVRRAGAAPYLVGRRLPGVPRHSGSLSASWSAARKLDLISRMRWVGPQFDDDENRRELASYCALDLSLVFHFSAQWELFLTGENITDTRIETARTANDVVSTGTPRFVFAGLRWRD